MAIKRCKFCGTEMDKRLSQCPNCQRKQGGNLKFFIIGFIAIAIIVAALNQDEPKVKEVNNGNVTTTKSGDVEPSNVDKEEFGLGEVVEYKDILTTLTSLTESTGSEYNKPTDGKVFLQCEFLIENNSTKDIAVSSLISFEAYCDDFSINQSIMGIVDANDKKSLDGIIATGKKMSGIIVYEVPTDWKEIEINYTPDFWGKKITFVATK
jgi:hypothetical protein